MGVLNKECARKRAKNLVCHAHFITTPTNPSVLRVPQIIIIYVVHTINRRSAYRESLENHRYYLCHVSLQLKLCYGLQKISQQECLGAPFAWQSVLQIRLAR